MGERRFRAAKKAGFKEIPALVRKMDDRHLRLYSIVENLHRQKLASKEEEDAVHWIWIKDFEPEGKSKADMARELGKRPSYVSDKISGYERRKELGLHRGDDERISTHDLRSVRGLESETAKKILEAKADGTLDTRDLDKYAPILRDAPEEKREEIMEGLLDAVH